MWLRSQAEPGAWTGTTGHVGGFSVGVLLARECVSQVMAAWQAAAAVLQGRGEGPGSQCEVHHAGTAVAVVGSELAIAHWRMRMRITLVLLVREMRDGE